MSSLLATALPSWSNRLAAWPLHLELGQTAAWLLPYLQGASPRCLALSPGTQPNCSLAPSLPPQSNCLDAWPSHLGPGQTVAWLLPYLQGAITSLLSPPTWDLAKLQLGSFLTSKEHHLAA
ncbi:hypothetical protein Adt_46714 [Abeliophyllum distichum]|uniref:Uncharacterized protein n=1 Tax=Abeliophyllum distichum TaxID=126358 RepID=A0ABD1NYE1_9LAMI